MAAKLDGGHGEARTRQRLHHVVVSPHVFGQSVNQEYMRAPSPTYRCDSRTVPGLDERGLHVISLAQEEERELLEPCDHPGQKSIINRKGTVALMTCTMFRLNTVEDTKRSHAHRRVR